MVGAVEVERRRLLLYIFGSRLAEVVGKKPAFCWKPQKRKTLISLGYLGSRKSLTISNILYIVLALIPRTFRQTAILVVYSVGNSFKILG